MSSVEQVQDRKKSFYSHENFHHLQQTVVKAVQSGMNIAMTKYPFLDQSLHTFEAATGLSRNLVVTGIALFPFAILALIYFTPVILGLTTIVYPVFMSVKAIENGKYDRTKWLTYWIILNSLTTLESMFGFFLFFLPFYSFFRSSYLTWCMMPGESNGSTISYKLFRPFFLKFVCTVESYFESTTLKLQNIVDDNQNLVLAAKATAVVITGDATILSGNDKKNE